MDRNRRKPVEHHELKVLVVEDNPDSADILGALLGTCGFQVTLAHSGQEGIQAARRLQPHIVLCDIGLPDGDGYVVATVLRQNSVTASARLIAVTAHGEAHHRRRALAAGFDQHLVKPVDPKVLLGELEVTL